MGLLFQVSSFDPWAEKCVGTCPTCKSEWCSTLFACDNCKAKGDAGVQGYVNIEGYLPDSNGTMSPQLELRCRNCFWESDTLRCPNDKAFITGDLIKARVPKYFTPVYGLLSLGMFLVSMALVVCTFGVILLFNTEGLLKKLHAIRVGLCPRWPVWRQFMDPRARLRFHRAGQDDLNERARRR